MFSGAPVSLGSQGTFVMPLQKYSIKFTFIRCQHSSKSLEQKLQKLKWRLPGLITCFCLSVDLCHWTLRRSLIFCSTVIINPRESRCSFYLSSTYCMKCDLSTLWGWLSSSWSVCLTQTQLCVPFPAKTYLICFSSFVFISFSNACFTLEKPCCVCICY